jgi:hypothetical protein
MAVLGLEVGSSIDQQWQKVPTMLEISEAMQRGFSASVHGRYVVPVV